MSSDETTGRSASRTSRLSDSMSDFAGEAIMADPIGRDRVDEGSQSALGALALFGPEATEHSQRTANIVTPSAADRRDGAADSVHDDVRAIRARLTANSPRGRFRFELRTPAALKSAVATNLSAVRSFVVLRFRAFVVQHPKLPVRVGLTASILVAGVIASHFVGGITPLTSHSATSSSTGSGRPIGEVSTTAPPAPAVAQTTPVVGQPISAVARNKTEALNSRNRSSANGGSSTDRSARAIATQAKNATATQLRKENPQVRRVNAERAEEVPLRTPTSDQTAGARAPQLAISANRIPAGVPAKPDVVPALPVVPPVQAVSVAAYENPGSVYSARDADVRPPQMLEADLPRPAVASWPTITNSVELVINQDGGVDRVKWLTNRERMPDVMLLSRAKMWKFSPALRDGQPVKYRLVLSWEVNP